MGIDLKDLESCSVSETVALVKQLLQRVQSVETLEAENASLLEQLRASKRATAQFSKGKPNPAPKKPGRRACKGRFERRAMPVTGPTEMAVHVPVPLESTDCPQCGASVDVVEHTASVEDTPPQPVRSITRFRVEHGRCHDCGWTGRGPHAGLATGQHGATAHRIGPHVIPQALALHYHFGLPQSQVPEVIAAATGIRLPQSALTQSAFSLAAEGGDVHTAYQELPAAVPATAVVNTDDTRWRIGGARAFLTGFLTPILAEYQIRWQHRHQKALEVLTRYFEGLLGTERGTSYEAAALDGIEQQKCLGHQVKNLGTVEETKSERELTSTRELKDTLREANKVRQEYRDRTCGLDATSTATHLII